MNNPLLDAALIYAERGWQVIPLKPRLKIPLQKEWQKKASSNPDTIRNWWSETPDANIGIVTGEKSNLFVIDVDDKTGPHGSITLDSVEKVVGPLKTLRCRTQSGGQHLFFEHFAGAGNKVNVLPGIDVRGSGGYVVAAPSIFENRKYEWMNTEAVAHISEPTVALMRHGEKIMPPIGIKEGSRNDELFKYASSIRSLKLAQGLADFFIGRAGELCHPPMDHRELAQIIQSASKSKQRQTPPLALTWRRASDIETKPVHWLWVRRFAQGKIAIIAGQPGQGKSQLTISMAATVSNGGEWPAGDGKAEVGNVIILSSEDDAADTIVPRLEAAGADISRVVILESLAKTPTGLVTIDLARDLELLEQVINEIGGASLLIIDPISAYLGDTDSHNNGEVRAFLAPIADFAARHEIAILAISHLSKSDSSDAMTRVSGSGAFVAVARCCYLVTDTPDDPDRKIMAPLKNNLGVDNIGYAFSIEPKTSTSGFETSCVVWEDASIKVRANELLAEAKSKVSRLELAKEFLLEVLKDGPMEQARVEYLSGIAGHTPRTLTRAKGDLGIKSSKGRDANKAWVWSLPEQSQDSQVGQQTALNLVAPVDDSIPY